MAGKSTDRPALMLVTDRLRAGEALLSIVDVAVDAGVDVVQIREKDLLHADLLALAHRIVSIVDGRASVVVNSDVNVALNLNIGLHLPEAAPMLSDWLAERLNPNALVGRSIHSPHAGVEKCVDYLLFGHVFKTNSKLGQRPHGLDALTTIAGGTTMPVWAIGGITSDNAASVIEAGASGIAVIGAILDAPDPRTATRTLRSEIDRAARLHIANPRKMK